VKNLLSVGDAAKRLGVSPDSVRRWTDHGELNAVRVGERADRAITPESVEKLAAERAARKARKALK
jgi:excisionase family DNA binding protein